jgi:protease PrsW
VLPVPLYLALALWIDRYEKEPRLLLVWVFLWGATFAFILSFVPEIVVQEALLPVILGSNAALAGTVNGSVVPGVAEEGCKALAVLILYLWKRSEFDGVIDGIVYAAMVGLGLAMIENVEYYAGDIARSRLAFEANFFVRSVLTPFTHPLITSLTGIGFGIASQSASRAVRIGAPIAGLLAAMTAHSLWDYATLVGGGLTGVAVVIKWIYLPLALLVVAFVVYGLLREGRLVRKHLRPELQSGVVTQQEYDSLGSVHGRIIASLGALRHGYRSWRRRARFAQVASELAFYRDRVSRGATTVEVEGRDAAYVEALRNRA